TTDGSGSTLNERYTDTKKCPSNDTSRATQLQFLVSTVAVRLIKSLRRLAGRRGLNHFVGPARPLNGVGAACLVSQIKQPKVFKKKTKNCILVRIMKHQSNIEKAPGSITNYLGAVCNIPIEDCKDFENFEEFEINGVVSVFLSTRKKKFEVLAELLNKSVKSEKPGIVLMEADEFRPDNEVNSNPSMQTSADVEQSNVIADENSDQGPEIEIQSGPSDEQNRTKKRKLTLSKSFDNISFADDQEWSSKNTRKNSFDLINRIAVDFLASQQKLIHQMEKMQQTMGEMSKKLDSLERIPKHTNCLASNQPKAPEAYSEKVSQRTESVESLYFKNLLIEYIERDIPERLKNQGLDKLKIEYPNSISKIKDIFMKECILKHVSDWKKMWAYSILHLLIGLSKPQHSGNQTTKSV
ncbi:hypothetical protein BpHYR1_053758, partial [Brachionus plicatilis]